jgi:hypothetical protein
MMKICAKWMGCLNRTFCAHAIPHESNGTCDWIAETKKRRWISLDCEEVTIEEDDLSSLALMQKSVSHTNSKGI